MTSVVAWIGADTRGPSSAYIAADSRFSWRTPSTTDTWDKGRKTFASSQFADIGGYWGDVLFPVVVLSQHFSTMDAGGLRGDMSSSKARFAALEKLMRISFSSWPEPHRQPFSVLYLSRDSSGMASSFVLRVLSWSPGTGWERQRTQAPKRSAVVRLGGSGAGTTAVHLQRWTNSSEGGTSRAIYSAFVDGLRAATDPYSGGAPQLVGLYRIGDGRAFGTVFDDHRYLYGVDADHLDAGRIEWRNELFERTSGVSRRRLPGAQRHRKI